jgi:hypothetical protein
MPQRGIVPKSRPRPVPPGSIVSVKHPVWLRSRKSALQPPVEFIIYRRPQRELVAAFL